MNRVEDDTPVRLVGLPAMPILVLVLLGAALKLAHMDSPTGVDAPGLWPLLHFVFLFACPVLIAYVAIRGYFAGGSASLLMLAGGIVSFAVGILLAALLLRTRGANASVTMHNGSLLLAGTLHSCGAVFALPGCHAVAELRRRRFLLFVVAGVCALLGILTFGLSRDLLPTFFIPGQGPTLLRQTLLALAGCLFLLPGVVFARLSVVVRSHYLHWYALALLLMATGVGCLFIQGSFGSPVAWVARAAQYVASVYLIVAVLRRENELRTETVRVDELLANVFQDRFHLLLEERTTQLSAANEQLRVEVQKHRQAEDALRHSEEHHRLVFDRNPLPMWVYDLQTLRFLMVNEAAQSHYGYSQAEFLAMTLRDIRPPEEVSALEAIVARLPRGPSYTHGWRHRKKDGTLIDVAIHSDEIQFDGRAARLVLAEDVSERRRTEQALRESDARASTFFRVSLVPAGISRIEDDLFVEVNDAFLSLFGYTRDEVLGHTAKDLRLWPVPEERAGAMQALHAQGCVRQLQAKFRRKSGEIRDALISAEVIELNGERYMFGTLMDITEQQRAREEKETLDALKQHLQKAESLGRMAGAIAHRFNNQLQVVIGNLERVKKEIPQETPAAQRAAQAMNAAIEAAKVSASLLTYLGQTPAQREPMDLSAACNQWLPALRTTLPEGMLLESALPVPGPTIVASANQIQQVLTNLVTNAWESLASGPGLMRLVIRTVRLALKQA